MPININYHKTKNNSYCAGLIVHKDAIQDTYDEKYKSLKNMPFGVRFNLNINSSLYNLPSVQQAFATCFVIKNKDGTPIIVTAKHVLDYCLMQTMTTTYNQMFSLLRIVFNYEDEYNNHSIKTKDIYQIEGIYNEAAYKNNKSDFVLFNIKPISKNKIFDEKLIGKVNFDSSYKNLKIHTYGYPYGMPLYTSYGTLFGESKTKKGYLITNLSAFNGHSGSPVFNEDKEIIGILFGGGYDFEPIILKKQFTNKKKLKYRMFKIEEENGIFILPITEIKQYL